MTLKDLSKLTESIMLAIISILNFDGVISHMSELQARMDIVIGISLMLLSLFELIQCIRNSARNYNLGVINKVAVGILSIINSISILYLAHDDIIMLVARNVMLTTAIVFSILYFISTLKDIKNKV